MEAKEWFKWIFIFSVLAGFSVSIFLKHDFVPVTYAYSYDEAKAKIDWNTIKNNTILIYTDEGDFFDSSSFYNKQFAVWQPAQDSFKRFIEKNCYSYEKIENNDKKIFLFSKISDNCRNNINNLPSEIKDAYKGLKKKETRNTISRRSLLLTPNTVS